MSYALHNDKAQTPKIEMPPLPQEPQEMDAIVEEPAQIVEQEVVEQTQPQQPVAQQESVQAKNFRELREQTERIARERDELLRKLQEAQQKQIEQPQEELYIKPDDLVEGKHLSKYDKKMKALEEQLNQYKQQSIQLAMENKLKSEFPDIEKVVSPENIEQLTKQHPYLAETLRAAPDLYTQAKSAYTMITTLGIAKQETGPAPYQENIDRIKTNNAKPRSLASISPQQGSDGALSRANAFANGLTDELKEQLRKEMYASRKMM